MQQKLRNVSHVLIRKRIFVSCSFLFRFFSLVYNRDVPDSRAFTVLEYLFNCFSPEESCTRRCQPLSASINFHSFITSFDVVLHVLCFVG